MDVMLNRILSENDAFYRHQQIDEEDLTESEKRNILQNLAETNAMVFLTRYGKYMKAEDCQNFKDHDDELVKVVLKQIIGKKTISKKERNNRRFNAMQQLLTSGDYFSDVKMREREPYLFDAMIGRFLDETQLRELRPTVSRKEGENLWSGLLDRFEKSCEIADRRNIQEMEWESSSNKLKPSDHGHDHSSRFIAHVSNQMLQSGADEFTPEEEDDEEGEDDVERMRIEMERLAKLEADQYAELGDDDTPEILRNEFESYMQQRFLSGKDTEFFDYPKCDNNDFENTKYIDPIKERDDEEKWFDEDD